MVGAINKFNGWLMKLCMVVAVICLLAVAGSLTLGIIMRFFFNTPLVGGDDFARIAMVCLAMICAPLGVYHSQHVSLSFLVDATSGVTAKLIQVAALACIIFVCVVALAYSGPFLRGGFSQTLPSIPWLSQGYGYAALPLGFALTAWIALTGAIVIIFAQDEVPESPLGADPDDPKTLAGGDMS